MTNKKRIVIIGGGTVMYNSCHFAACSPAYGTTPRLIERFCQQRFNDDDYNGDVCKSDNIIEVWTYLTKMAGVGPIFKEFKQKYPKERATYARMEELDFKPTTLETNYDVEKLVDQIIQDDTTRIVFFPVAMCDWVPADEKAGKYSERLKTSEHNEITIRFKPAPKVINKIRAARKDIFLVGFKTTTGYTEDQQYVAGLNLCKQASCNLVLANDTVTRMNMVVTPEEARYHVTKDRETALAGLIDMTWHRTHLNFTRSTVIGGNPIPWDSELIPPNLRTVVNYCIQQNAYKPFNGVTAGHFACRISDNNFLTSIRKTNFNDLPKNGLVLIKTDGPDTVLAYGAKPSVGGQSQRIVFNDHPGYDCIVHFHCPLKDGSEVPVVSQREFECGSHQCGNNTSKGLKQFGNLKAVFLEQHGPNVVFSRDIDPLEVINFIEANFDLSQKTGGFVSGH